jgi:hypothetical protein
VPDLIQSLRDALAAPLIRREAAEQDWWKAEWHGMTATAVWPLA